MKNGFIMISIGLLICFFSSASYAGNTKWINYTNGDQVNSLAEQGEWIWAATNGGLVKINRTADTTICFNKANSPLPQNHIQTVSVNDSGDIWLTCCDVDYSPPSGLVCFNEEKSTCYTKLNSALPGNQINCVVADDSGNTWIGTASGLACFDGTTWTVYDSSNSDLPANDIESLALDTNSAIWMAAGGLACLHESLWTCYDSTNSGLAHHVIEAMAIDTEGKLWLASGGLVCFDGTSWTVYDTSNSALPANDITVIAPEGSGKVWVGTYYDGLACLDGANWTVYDTSNSGLPSNWIRSLLVDESGNLWIGTQAGLMCYDGISWTPYTTSNSGLPDNHIWSINIDDSANVWIGTAGHDLVRYDGIDWTVYPGQYTELPDPYYQPVIFDADRNVYWAEGCGLVLQPPGTLEWEKVYNTSNSALPDNNITDLALDEYGNLWIGTHNGGVAVFNKDGIYTSIEKDHNEIIEQFSLYQNYPNPFNPITHIQYNIPQQSDIRLTIYDLAGNLIREWNLYAQAPGQYEIIWDGLNSNGHQVSAGVYLYKLQAEEFMSAKKMIFMK